MHRPLHLPPSPSVLTLLTRQHGSTIPPEYVNLKRLTLEECTKARSTNVDSDFQQTTVEVPDFPPIRDSTASFTTVNHLTLGNTYRTTLENLRAECVDLKKASFGAKTVVSNCGGFHSPEEVLFRIETCTDEAGEVVKFESDKFCGLADIFKIVVLPLISSSRPVSITSTQTIELLSKAITTPIPIPTKTETTTTTANDSSNLLLRTQAVRFSHDFNYISVPPTPSTLVIFPGYCPHAVASSSPLSSDMSPRISIACNLKKTNASWLVTGWCNVNIDGDFNALHDHGDCDFALVLYI